MENVWEKLKSLKGRSWLETKDILNKIVKDIPHVEEVVIKYNVNSETLPVDDEEIYGVYPKSEPFYLERCKICSHLLKSSVLTNHYDLHHNRNSNNVKETTFVSPGRKRNSKKSNKSTSEDDSESVISSDATSPNVDLQETQSNDSNTGTTRSDSIIDIISVDEIPSEESKPPTPGPQDFYEDFAVPYAEEIHVLSLAAENGGTTKPTYSNSKSALKLKLATNKDSNVRSSSSTSLLEAHLLSNSKYNPPGNFNLDINICNSNYKLSSAFVKNDGKIIGNDENFQKSEDVASSNQVQSVTGFPKLKTETKISIPISTLPQNVKIIESLKKSSLPQLTTVGQNSISDSTENYAIKPSSGPFETVTDAVEVSELNEVKVKLTQSKRSKRSKAKNRSTKNVEYDPDKHCGILINENRHCLRSLTCKTHTIASRRAVEGRSKDFDQLLADHRASKVTLKEPDKGQSVSLCETTVNVPILVAEDVSEGPNQIRSDIHDSDYIKIRVPNANSNAKIPSPISNHEKSQNDDLSLKIDPEGGLRKISFNLKTPAASVEPLNVISKVFQSTSSLNGEVKPQIYDSDIKISFVCSDMLYKVGGLLHTDRSRQAIRKCVEPLKANGKPHIQPPSVHKQKVTDFLHLVKNIGAPPKKLRLFRDDKTITTELGVDIGVKNSQKVHNELERMKTVLSNASKILNNLAVDEDKMSKFRLSTLRKRKTDRLRLMGGKKIKQESISDENYDLNMLFSFDKCVTKSEHMADNHVFDGGMSNIVMFGNDLQNGVGSQQETAAGAAKTLSASVSNAMDDMSYNMYLNQQESGATAVTGMSSGYAENETVQLLQTYKDLENEIRNTIGSSNIQELYPSQPSLSNSSLNTATAYLNYMDANGGATISPNNVVEFKPNSDRCENEYKMQQQPMDSNMSSIEETISKNYALLEEYCKNISTDELFLDNKGNMKYNASSSGTIRMNNMPLRNKNEMIVVNNAAISAPLTPKLGTSNSAVDGLSFDSHVLNTFLSSFSADTSNHTANEMNFVDGQPYDISSQNQTVSKERVYKEILTLDKQF